MRYMKHINAITECCVCAIKLVFCIVILNEESLLFCLQIVIYLRTVTMSYVLQLSLKKYLLFYTGVGKYDGHEAVEDAMHLIPSELSTTLISMR